MTFHKTRLALLIAGLSLGVTGCAGFNQWNTFKSPEAQNAQNLGDAVKGARGGAFHTNVVTETDSDLPLALTEVEADDVRDNVSLSANNTAFFGLIKGLAAKQGYALGVVDGVDTGKRIAVQINGLSTVAAVRQIANLAGYVAVVNHADRTVTIATQATYTFKLPPALFKKLAATYTVGGDPAAGGSSGGSGSSGMSGGGMSGGSSGSGASSPIKASFVVTGESKNEPKDLETFIRQLAGGNAHVQVYAQTGMITVRSSGQALKRVQDFIQTYCQDGMRQVSVAAAIVEVGINDEFQYGIKWDKILNAAGTKSFNYDMTGVNTPIAGATPATLNITTASITSVVQALEQFTRTRVVSQPTAVTLNHVPATLFDGQQIPYLPSIQNTMSGTTGTTQSSATGAYALQGVSISVVPDIMDNNLVQLTLVPVTSSVGKFSTFTLGANQGSIQMPQQTIKQSTMQVMVQNDRTVILGGARANRASDTNTGLPWLTKLPLIGALAGATDAINGVTESVVMVHTRILPAPRYEPLVAEAL